MTTITLTEGQQKAFEEFTQFILDPYESVFVLQGFSGTGKSTLVRTLIDRLDGILKTAKLLKPDFPRYDLTLTATTNKACEALSGLTGHPVSTIHSTLGLRVQTDYNTGNANLVPRQRGHTVENQLLFIDEASFIDAALLKWIFKICQKCKIVFIGDPAQLTPVKSNGTPVFNSKFKTAQLTEVVRQAKDNPIIDLSTKFRHTVNTGEFFSFKPDGHYIQYKDRPLFEEAIIKEFTREDWVYNDSKVLAWTNKTVINYNHAIRDIVKGNPQFQEGDYAICNKFMSLGRHGIKTDQLVQITGISPSKEEGLEGHCIEVDHEYQVFMPNSLEEKNALIKKAKAEDNAWLLQYIDNNWIDLRAAYACTVNKSQGSTYKKVFIDLDDIRRCTSGETIARMMYVAVSRASTQVILTGDLI